MQSNPAGYILELEKYLQSFPAGALPLFWGYLQLAFLANAPHYSTPVTQTNLTAFQLGDKPNFLEPILTRISHPPDMRAQLVAGQDWAGKAGLELLDVAWI